MTLLDPPLAATDPEPAPDLAALGVHRDPASADPLPAVAEAYTSIRSPACTVPATAQSRSIEKDTARRRAAGGATAPTCTSSPGASGPRATAPSSTPGSRKAWAATDAGRSTARVASASGSSTSPGPTARVATT